METTLYITLLSPVSPVSAVESRRISAAAMSGTLSRSGILSHHHPARRIPASQPVSHKQCAPSPDLAPPPLLRMFDHWTGEHGMIAIDHSTLRAFSSNPSLSPGRLHHRISALVDKVLMQISTLHRPRDLHSLSPTDTRKRNKAPPTSFPDRAAASSPIDSTS